MRAFLFALLTVAALPAGVDLNTPVAQPAFYDGNSDYFNFDGTGFINGISSATLPYADDRAPYIIMLAEGSASGSFTVDTQVAVQFAFSAPGLSWEIPFFVQGSLTTSNGYYYAETSLFSETGGSSFSPLLAKNGFSVLIPAGAEILSWQVVIGAGSYGGGSGPQSLTLNIPANSITLIAFNTAAGLAALLIRRLRHPV